MSRPGDRAPSEIIDAFLRRWTEDREAGRERRLEDYQAEFPGHEEALARKWRELQDPGVTRDEPRGVAPDARSDPSAGSPPDGSKAGPPDDAETHERIGAYRLLYALGEGGMGTVYLAEQTEPIRRRVALKRIKLGMDTREVIARFEAERQALAMMSHPNIARVFDAGTTPEGQPYFVMEYVQGEPINEYCDHRRLTLRQRLELFLRLVEGVQHAHQKGIIHRDIKPSNVLVALDGEEPVPKIIDFGIAKSLHQPLTERTAFTHQGQLVGTPAYTSPEQAEGGVFDVDTRTDIYSLGGLLYELLTGALPIDLRAMRVGSLAELQRRIAEEDVVRPSARLARLGDEAAAVARARGTEPAALRRELRGDLDWIILRALEKDRARRYPSASEFAADLRRYLRHEPVLARPPELGYRLRKFARRHRMPLAVAGVILLALVAAVVADRVFERIEAARESREALARGRERWSDYLESKSDQVELRDRWGKARADRPPHYPVWLRRDELALHEQVGAGERQVARHYSQALTEFYNAFQRARPGSSEAHAVIEELQASVWPVFFSGGPGPEARLGTDFLEVLFRPRGASENPLAAPERQTVRVESEPPGAEVFCFRYELLDGRLYPFPWNATSDQRARGPFLRVDRVLEDGGGHRGSHGAREAGAGAADTGGSSGRDALPFLPGDRLLRVGGKEVHRRGELVAALRDVVPGAAVRVALSRDDEIRTVSWVPFPETRPAKVLDLGEAFGFTLEAFPLDPVTESRVGTAPLEVRLAAGSYLLLLRAPGRADTRRPVTVPLFPEEEGKPLRVRLYRPGSIPEGFVHVPAGPFGCGGDPEVDQPLERHSEELDDYFVQRHEVTVGDYLAFLNDPESGVDGTGRRAPRSAWAREILELDGEDGGEDGARDEVEVDLLPYHHDSGLPLITYRASAGRWERTGSLRDPEWPIISVSHLAAAEYAHWFDRRRGDAWRFRLPTDVEWEKAARGVDRRAYPWGDYMVWAFCHSPKGDEGKDRPAPVGVHPVDESVYGARDLAGSVSELTIGVIDDVTGLYAIRGGNWYTVTDYVFRAANRNGRKPDGRRGTDTGIRLVAVPRR